MSDLGSYLFNTSPSGSVTGRAICLSSAENYGQSLKCGLHILGFPRIIYYVQNLSEPKKVEIQFRN